MPWYRSSTFWWTLSSILLTALSFLGLIASFLLDQEYTIWAVNFILCLLLTKEEAILRRLKNIEWTHYVDDKVVDNGYARE